jgi:hypothetical protein
LNAQYEAGVEVQDQPGQIQLNEEPIDEPGDGENLTMSVKCFNTIMKVFFEINIDKTP